MKDSEYVWIDGPVWWDGTLDLDEYLYSQFGEEYRKNPAGVIRQVIDAQVSTWSAEAQRQSKRPHLYVVSPRGEG